MAISKTQSDIIFSLVCAELAYAQMLRELTGSDRLEAFDRQLNLRRQVRGEPELVSASSKSGPLRLTLEEQLAPVPSRRHTPSDCGLVQLERSRSLDLRKKLQSAIVASGLAAGTFARWVLGADPITIHRYLHGGEIPAARASWIRKLEGVRVNGGGVDISLTGFSPSRRYFTEKKRRIGYDA